MNGIRIGDYDKRVTIQHPVTRDIGDGGGREEEWTDLDTVWARFSRPKVSTAVEQEGLVSVVTQEIDIRQREDILPGMKLLYRQQTFDILHVLTVFPEKTTLVCQEVTRHV